MFSKAIVVNIFLSFFNIFLKFYLNYYLANNFDEINLIRYFTLIDIITIISMITVGFKDTLVRTVGIYGESFSLFFFKKIPIFILVFFLLFIPLVFAFLSYTKISEFKYDLYIIEIMSFVFIANLLITHFLLAYREYAPVSTFEFIKGLLFTSTFFLLIFVFNVIEPFKFLVLAFIISNIGIFLWLLPKLVIIYKRSLLFNKTEPFKINNERKKVVLTSFSFSSMEYLCSSLIIYSSSLMMLSLYGQDQVGDLQVVARPIYLALITIFSFPIFRFLFPEFVELINIKNYKKIKDIKYILYILISLGSLILIILCWIFSQKFISYLFPEDYANSYKYLNILVISLPFVIFTSVFFALIKSQEHFIATFVIRFIGLILFIMPLLIFYFFNFKEISVAYSILISSIVMFISSFIYERKIRSYE
jgi:O-antigen/teichoic acid export membrane protein